MADDDSVTTDGIAAGRMLWSPTTTIHVGDSTDGDVQGGDGIEIFDLGSGVDTAGAGRNFNIILGGSGADILKAEGYWEDVFGGSGDDTITATGKGAWLFGGTGNDTITGSDTDWYLRERLFGGDGNDIIDGGGGRDIIYGGAGDDSLTGGSGADIFVFSEGHGTDTIQDFNAAEGDKIHLIGFDKTITWAQLSGKITTVTDPNDDTIVTGVQIDLSDWGGGTITLKGVTKTDLTEDNFYLSGAWTVWRYGDSDDNEIDGGGGNNLIYGFEGADTLRGEQGDDWLFGGEGADALDGGEGDDVLFGGEGDDTLTGGAGEDMLIGGEGDDMLTGGADADTFVFGEDSGNDTITDFDTTQDKIHLATLAQTITWAQLQSKITTVTDPGDPNTVIALKIDLTDWGGGTITLTGLTAVSDLTEDMFILDKIVGADGVDDTLQGGTSDDEMTGGTGADTFVFNEDSGSDTITDFSTTEGDRIDLTAFTSSITWAQLQAVMTQVDDDPLTTGEDETATVIDLSSFGGGSITLKGVTKTDLTEDMFVLDDFAGGTGDDTLEGGATDDTLTGGGGADTFVFSPGHGDDRITDFTADTDKIDLTAFTGITGLDDLIYWQSGGDTLIYLRFDGGGTIRLEGVLPDELDADDFVFYQDQYTGTAGAETLVGGAGDDTITGLGGDDTLTGNDGYDTFVFAAGHGDDTVTDFTDGEDLIDLSAFTGITQFSDLTVTQEGNHVKIDLSGQTDGGSITLQNILLADIDEDDFVFYEAPPDGG